jgi:tagatose 6-phosphate kinase
VVLCGSLPDGLPTDIYGTLVTYAAEAGVPAIVDAGGEELKHAVDHGPDLVVAQVTPADAGSIRHLGADLVRLGAAAAAVANGTEVRAVTPAGEWTARLTPESRLTPEPRLTPESAAAPGLARGALVAGLVPGQLLGWSWPDRLRHALALASVPESARVDLAAYERLLDAVIVEPS